MRSIRYPIVHSGNDPVWQKHCGFLDLTTEQFMAVQEILLAQQLERIGDSPLARKLMGDHTPKSIDELRRRVPLSTYQYYAPEFESGDENALPEKPFTWAHTSGGSGTFKRIPCTRDFYHHVLDALMAALILCCSERRGQSDLIEGDKVLFNVAPHPYLSGIMASGACQTFTNLKAVMPADEHDSMDFKDKVAKGFETSLKTGVDILVAMTSVLVKLGNDFSELSRRESNSKRPKHPAVLYRFARAYLHSKLEKIGILPKDLWPVKGLIGWGIDTGIYREQVRQAWGTYPYELHASTEAGIMGLQSWNKKDLTLLPTSNFYEFIPEEEWLACRDNIFAQPSTVLLPDVIPGKRYELVITSFHGMPFIRYRLGHLVNITAPEDPDAQVRLPQLTFESRADDLLDIAGFTRLSEKTVAQALANANLHYEDWTMRKEVNGKDVALHLYIEMNGNHPAQEVATALQQELVKLDPGYRDLEQMMGIRPLEVTFLHPGTFSDYYARKKAMGAELMQRQPPRMNAPDEIIMELMYLSDAREVIMA
ncbi:MAG TPA: GH3 auxin-responsive promoter family protein [Dehalococcoidia bacterium]|nr:GH3 auxin-responsive promoter family protein [Dehalococcoidia bacterium]